MAIRTSVTYIHIISESGGGLPVNRHELSEEEKKQAIEWLKDEIDKLEVELKK